jgi:hypothetical protein
VLETGEFIVSLDLHVGAYNHFEGGIDRDASGGRRLERLDRQLDLLAPLGLDVLISTEAKGWFDPGDDAALDLARSRLGLTPLWALAPRHDCNIVVWINPERLHDPEERHESSHPFWHVQARASVRVEGLAERLWLLGAHFSPFVPRVRVDEAYATCDLADGRLVLGGGDFNDDGLMDPIPDRSGMPAYKRLSAAPTPPTAANPAAVSPITTHAPDIHLNAARDRQAGAVTRQRLETDQPRPTVGSSRFHLLHRA